MGRRNGSGRVPQRSRLIANREHRTERASHAFAMFRPVSGRVAEDIHSLLRPLQDENDIPGTVRLFDHDMHASIIQERRVRKGLAKGLAAGFAVGTALGHIESGLRSRGRGTLEARFTGVDVIGRNRTVLIGRIDDEEGVLRQGRLATANILSSMGLHFEMDKVDHVTLGVDEGGGLTQTERRHVMHTVTDMIADLTVVLEPVIVEHAGRRVPLSDFKAA